MATALITGSARGIGAAIAERLASDGFNIAFNDINESCFENNDIVERIRAKGVEAEVFTADVSKYAACEEMVKAVKERFGTIEVLVNKALSLLFNAGMDMQEIYDEGLNTAVFMQNKDLALKFLLRGAHPDSAGPGFCFGFPPLVKAVKAKDRSMVIMLAEYGALAGSCLPEVQALLKQREDSDE